MNPVETILAVAEIGGRLQAAELDKLKMLLPADCPPEIKEAIRANKPSLLELLSGPPFVIVRSDLLPEEALLWTANERGRELLVAHGASPGAVYTHAELAALVDRNTDPSTLITLHRAKRMFNGRILDQEP